MGNVIIKLANYSQDFPNIQEIRKIVFQQEQGVSTELEFDGEDENCQHLIAYLDEKAVGTARIRYLNAETVKMERLAVLPIARRQGIGKQITIKALEIIANQNVSQVIVHAQEDIKGLYTNLGFAQEGEIFVEAGISHVKMSQRLN